MVFNIRQLWCYGLKIYRPAELVTVMWLINWFDRSISLNINAFYSLWSRLDDQLLIPDRSKCYWFLLIPAGYHLRYHGDIWSGTRKQTGFYWTGFIRTRKADLMFSDSQKSTWTHQIHLKSILFWKQQTGNVGQNRRTTVWSGNRTRTVRSKLVLGLITLTLHLIPTVSVPPGPD